MAPDHDSEGGGSERRSAPRITARSLVEVRLPTWEALRSVYTINISQGGIRLSHGARAPLAHTQTEIELYIKELQAGRTPTSKTKSIPPGMLIKKKT